MRFYYVIIIIIMRKDCNAVTEEIKVQTGRSHY